VPKPQQSLFPLFIALRNEWNARKLQRQREEAEERNAGSQSVLLDKDNPLVRRPSMNSDGYYFK